MSAYIVDRNHIRYLVESALAVAMRNHRGRCFRWYHDGEAHELTDSTATEVGQMLWDENIASVAHRYRDSILDGLPGPVDDHLGFQHHMADYPWNVAQILQSTDCYEYQSCEHPDWGSSNAMAFIDALRYMAYRLMAGYEEAEWGAPQPTGRDIAGASLRRYQNG